MKTIECRAVQPLFADELVRFFRALKLSGTEEFFHPHSLTAEAAKKLADYEGKDLYYLLTDGSEVLGYGMLRGWDDGYEVPSLGIVIDPALQGRGYGRMLMQFLHAAAKYRGARRIRLSVSRENTKAKALFESLGYTPGGEQDGAVVYYCELP